MDILLKFSVFLLIFGEAVLKIKAHAYGKDNDYVNVWFYRNIQVQLLVETGAILACFIYSFLPKASIDSCILMLFIIVLTSYNLYKNYCFYCKIRNIIKRYKK